MFPFHHRNFFIIFCFYFCLWFAIIPILNTVMADVVCVQDTNGDGKSLDPNETAGCDVTAGGNLCPFNAVDCNYHPPVCALDQSLVCDGGQCKRPKQCVSDSNVSRVQIISLISAEDALTTLTTEMRQIESISLISQHPSSTVDCEINVTYGFSGNQLWVDGGCDGLFDVVGRAAGFQCPVSGETFLRQQDCDSACEETGICSNPYHSCPLGGSYACLNNAGNFQCSNLSCQDLSQVPPVNTATDVSTKRQNDGLRNADGSCAAEINIFGGKRSACKTKGVKSAFRNCCSESDEVIQDNMSMYTNVGLAVDVGALVYTAAAASYQAYLSYTAAGAANAGASSAAYFSQVLVASGPAVVAAVAIAVAVNYYSNACGPGDLETAMLAGSKMCHFVGHNCTEKWLSKCVQEEKVYCCFNSKIGRIVHEQGRLQLKHFVNYAGGVFGFPENPYCRGFLQEEFQALDFSRIDLSEYYADVSRAATTLNIADTIQTEIEAKTNALP